MVVCQYYLEGRCRFGASCRNEHVQNSGAKNTRSEAVGVAKVYDDMVTDLIAAERGKQWPLSCYAPVRDRPCIPGLKDTSPEELRAKFYQAKSTNTLDQYVAETKQLLQNVEQVRTYLKQPTHVLWQMLEELLSSKTLPAAQTTAAGPGNIFGGSAPEVSTSTPNIFSFGSSSHQNNIFSQPSTSSMFNPSSSSATNNMFANSTTAPSQGLFASVNPPTTAPQAGLFSSVGSSAQFNNQTVSPNIFGGGSLPQASSTNIFGAPKSSGSVFDAPVQGTQSSIFGAQQTSPIFGTSQNTTNNLFGSSNAGNIFGAATTPGTGGIFGNLSQTSPTSSGSTGISSNPTQTNSLGLFGSSVPGNSNIFGVPAQATGNTFPPARAPPNDNSFTANSAIITPPNIFGGQSLSGNDSSSFKEKTYSLPEDLSEEDKASFSSSSFTFGKIPLKPPAQIMC